MISERGVHRPRAESHNRGETSVSTHRRTSVHSSPPVKDRLAALKTACCILQIEEKTFVHLSTLPDVEQLLFALSSHQVSSTRLALFVFGALELEKALINFISIHVSKRLSFTRQSHISSFVYLFQRCLFQRWILETRKKFQIQLVTNPERVNLCVLNENYMLHLADLCK